MGRFALFVILIAIAPAALTAQVDQMPKREPGLWEMTVSTGVANAPPQTVKLCIDAATDATLFNYGIGASKKACSKNELKIEGKQVTGDAVCNVAGTQMTSHSTTKFTGEIAYHTDVKVHYEPPMMGQSDATMVQDGKWTGPCPADMQPGDMIGPDGAKINLMQMMGQ